MQNVKPETTQPQTKQSPTSDCATCGLHELACGGRGSVVAIGGDDALRRRLLEMGLCNGACIEMVRRAPLGDPIEFRVRGYSLSLREAQAQLVQISLQ